MEKVEEEEDESRMSLERVEGEKWGGRKVELCEISEQGDDEMEDCGLLPKTSLPHGDSVSSPSDEIRPSETSQDLEEAAETKISNIQENLSIRHVDHCLVHTSNYKGSQ